ncbi:monovalent cation:proton antiporter-2 (CPA2) family protein [Phenylobacterium immobile]|uniref:monovalent cation:proton antiporter-2 (CPA2) family protein n=1 Tax=Phenylobacterium immobile TaxID=21 RepID=UPI000A403B6A|nr:monovalent cation:proton antiporter-2 (CPA2) family protein [Phenylobacterium immobile]
MTQSLLFQVMVYLAAGVIAAPIAKRLGLGSVLGYLVAGVIVGPFALNLVGEPGDVMKVAEFGVVILLFLIGLELRPQLLWGLRKSIFGLGLGQMVACTAITAGAALALGMEARTALAAGLILAMSSTAIVLQSLDEKGLRQAAPGQAAFGVLLFQDLSVIPLFTLLPLLAIPGLAAHDAAGGHGSHSGGLLAGLPLWAGALGVMAAVAAVVVGGRYLTRPVFRFIASTRLREIFTASALLLVVAVAVLMEMVGLSPALGAFLAGVVLADSEFRRELEADIEPFRGLLLSLFFITVGAGLDLKLVASRPLELFGLVLGLMVAKAGAMYVVARLLRTPARTAAITSVFLAQGGEFAFVLLGFALSVSVLAPDQAALLTAIVALSMALAPLAMAAVEKLTAGRDVDLDEPEPLPFDQGDPDAIVAGFGRFGQIAARVLMANNFKVVTLDSSIEQIDVLRKFGWRVHYGDASRLDLLRAAGAEKAKLLLVAIDDTAKAKEMIEAASHAFPHLSIIARAYDRQHAYELLKLGVEDIERETFESALAFTRRALTRLGFSDRRAARATTIFRDHDRETFLKLASVATGKTDQGYIDATRQSRAMMEGLLRAEMAAAGDDDADNRTRARRPVEAGESQV